MEKRKERLKLIFDTCSLITASKFKVDDKLILDYLLEVVDIHIPEEVYLEAVKGFKKYQDAREIKLRVEDAKIRVHEVMWEKTVLKELENYNIGLGEKELILLYQMSKDFDYAIIDDFLACIICKRFKVDYLLLLDLIVICAQKKLLRNKIAIQMIDAIKSRYDAGFINHTISMLKMKG